MNKDIYILGIGHNTVVYIDLIEDCSYNIKGLFHYNDSLTGSDYYGYPILGSYDDLFNDYNLKGLNFALSQGDNKIRSELFDRILLNGGTIPTLIHPSANVSKRSKLGIGVVIHINAVVHPDVTIGNNTVFSYNTAITHTSSIGNHCYLAAFAMIGAYTTINDFVFIGIGAKTISGKVTSIGDNAYLGAGALVINNVEADSTVIGSPAKVYVPTNK